MAYNFNGSNQYLSASAPVTTWPLTLACWFYTADTTNTGVLMHVGNKAALSRFLLSYAGALSGDPVRTNSIDSSNVNCAANSTSGYAANTWTHAAGVHASESSRVAYCNGGNAGTDTATCGGLSGINGLTIGMQQWNNGGAASNAYALIAEAAVWNVALTADEVASLGNGFTPDKIRPQSLVFYAPLVRDLVDVKGGLTITNNSATVAAHPRVYA